MCVAGCFGGAYSGHRSKRAGRENRSDTEKEVTHLWGHEYKKP